MTTARQVTMIGQRQNRPARTPDREQSSQELIGVTCRRGVLRRPRTVVVPGFIDGQHVEEDQFGAGKRFGQGRPFESVAG